MYDKNGKLFDPAEYASYSTTSSYIDYSVNRVNDPEKGMSLEFPYTPWPVGLTYSYIRGTAGMVCALPLQCDFLSAWNIRVCREGPLHSGEIEITY